MSTIGKEYVEQETGNRFILRRTDYNHTPKALLELYAEAKIDFPELQPHQVEIVHYGGERYRGTYGIGFTASAEPLREYQKLSQVELTL